MNYKCQECDAKFLRWQGQCLHCASWNSLIAEDKPIKRSLQKSKSGMTTRAAGFAGLDGMGVQTASSISIEPIQRLSTGLGEFDRVLGGGFVPGSVTLIGGDPGAGKSTLLLQVACHLSDQHKVLYVSGEESLSQIAVHLRRLALAHHPLLLLSEIWVPTICEIAQQHQPVLLIIDSIQVLQTPESSAPAGSVSQVREAAARLTQFAKQNKIATVLVGHVTKEGMLAGPKVLEHCVDSSLLLESTAGSRFRSLRGQKNRFGPVNELGLFAMMPDGLKPVRSPSALFLDMHTQKPPGSATMAVLEGNRTLLVEVQALVDPLERTVNRQQAVGLDNNRLSMIMAILNRHTGLKIGMRDIFVNVVGGLRISDTGADLPVALALCSSVYNQPLPEKLICFGELGLAGEVRPVVSGPERAATAAKHGFHQLLAPNGNLAHLPTDLTEKIKLLAVSNLAQALAQVGFKPKNI